MMMTKMLMVMMMVLIYIANQSYLVAVPAVLSLLLGRSFGLNKSFISIFFLQSFAKFDRASAILQCHMWHGVCSKNEKLMQ